MSTWFEIAATVLLGGLGLYLTWVNHKKGKAELFYKLFTDFNNRYNNLNDDLYQLLQEEKDIDQMNESKISELKTKYYTIVIDYLNLCSEEFMWKNKKYIDKNVWRSWQEGIMWWYNSSQIIRAIWEDEKVNVESYYVHKGKTFIVKYKE